MTTERAEIEEADGRAGGGFAGFFERSYPGMLARALLLSGHRQDAEDAVQEGYAEAFRRWERLRAYEAPDAWVYRVVRQRLWAVGRRRARHRSAETRLPQPPPTASVEQTAEARAVLSALASATPTGSRSRAVDQPPRSSRGFAWGSPSWSPPAVAFRGSLRPRTPGSGCTCFVTAARSGWTKIDTVASPWRPAWATRSPAWEVSTRTFP